MLYHTIAIDCPKKSGLLPSYASELAELWADLRALNLSPGEFVPGFFGKQEYCGLLIVRCSKTAAQRIRQVKGVRSVTEGGEDMLQPSGTYLK